MEVEKSKRIEMKIDYKKQVNKRKFIWKKKKSLNKIFRADRALQAQKSLQSELKPMGLFRQDQRGIAGQRRGGGDGQRKSKHSYMKHKKK